MGSKAGGSRSESAQLLARLYTMQFYSKRLNDAQSGFVQKKSYGEPDS